MGLMKKTQEHYFYWHEIRLLLLLMHTFAARQVIGIHWTIGIGLTIAESFVLVALPLPKSSSSTNNNVVCKKKIWGGNFMTFVCLTKQDWTESDHLELIILSVKTNTNIIIECVIIIEWHVHDNALLTFTDCVCLLLKQGVWSRFFSILLIWCVLLYDEWKKNE